MTRLTDHAICAAAGPALLAAALFGASTPLAKALLEGLGPWMLAALLYLGSGLGLALLRQVRRLPAARLERADRPWLAAAILSGGVAGPVLLMYGLSAMPASGASLLLNAEGVFTALLAWFAFKENFDRCIALGMLAIVAGAVVLSWPGEASFGAPWPALAVLGACLAWAFDNNLTRKVSLADAGWVAMVKGLAAGSVNFVIAWTTDAQLPPLPLLLAASLLGFVAYGVSLSLFIVSLRQLGAARTGAYFSVAPFFGAVLSVLLLDEAVTAPLLVAGLLMAAGLWLHLSERHSHAHAHEALEHDHVHRHDDGHHDHHAPGEPHRPVHGHRHRHQPEVHEHPHFPDAHHRHTH